MRTAIFPPGLKPGFWRVERGPEGPLFHGGLGHNGGDRVRGAFRNLEGKVNIWMAVGTGSLGILIGSMVRVVFRSLTELNVQTLASLISVLAGAGVIAIFNLMAGGQAGLPNEAWGYPIGLLVGYVFTALLEPDM